MSNKYKNVRGSMFDSKLEEACYRIIAEIIPPNRIVKNYPIVLTASVSWRVDFAILNAQNSPVFFIEAKGYPTDTFRLKLRLFQDIYPDQLLLLCFASEHNAQKCKKMHKYVTSLLWLKNKLLSFPVIKEIAQ